MLDKPIRTQLLDLLWERQDAKGYISDADVNDLARYLSLSEVEIEGVLSFYHFFTRTPTGKYTVYLNNSIISECRGYADIRQAFIKATGAEWGKVDPGGDFGLFDTPCIGLSDQEPAALINWYPFTNLTPERVYDVVEQLRLGVPVETLADEVPDNIRHTPPPEDTVFFREHVPGRALGALLNKTPEEVIEQIKTAKLSGRGGAFFPTGLKWAFCRQNPGEARYVVCNADEGEPGTFKDRVLMNHLPGLMLEGMIIGGYAIGAEEGIIYLRAEYRWLKPRLEATIAEYEAKGFLGDQIAAKEPFRFRIRIQMGAGAYVCGEETALLESMEGKRGEPRTRTYFPVERGFLGQPTIVNNVETFCGAARIMELGAEHFARLGTKNSSGTKVLSVSGDCGRPGIYEIEWGMPVRELMNLCGAPDPYYVQMSGPSGQCISKKELNRAICREDLLCGGSVMIFDQKRDILRILQNFSAFFRRESCGMCTPCRAGNFIFSRKLERMGRNLSTADDLVEIRNWSTIMKQASRCGLGQTASNALVMALDKFPSYFNDLTQHSEATFNRGFDLNSALEDYQAIVKK
jgi:[NiFe] hydrogenase diaphorase moiety large subunit